jgi:hypothetical protein
LQPGDSEAQLSTDHSEIRKNSKKDSTTGKNASNAVFSTAIWRSSAESPGFENEVMTNIA